MHSGPGQHPATRHSSAVQHLRSLQLGHMSASLQAWTLLFGLLLLCSAVSSLRLSNSFSTNKPQDLFSQIAADLAPYKARGISNSMVDGVYCGIRDPGFRVQIKNQEVYVVGEVESFQSRNRNIKLALVDVASQYTDLPDVDLVVGTYDWTATEVQPVPGFEEGGPIFAQVNYPCQRQSSQSVAGDPRNAGSAHMQYCCSSCGGL